MGSQSSVRSDGRKRQRRSALILGNRVINNSGAGLNLIPELDGVSGYADNVIDGVVTDDAGNVQPQPIGCNGTVTGGQAIGCNLIDGSLICPSQLPFNTRQGKRGNRP